MQQGRANGKRRAAVAGVLLLLLGGIALAALVSTLQSPPGPAAPARVFASQSFIFSGGAGDFGGIGNADMLALAKRLKAANATFLLAAGDLGYTSDESGWCASIKGAFNETIVIAGNHDTSESGPGDITQTILYCPMLFGVPVTAGPRYGYGISYYFDYPVGAPLARFIMVTPGITASPVSGQNYASGGAEYNWVTSAVNNARAAGIPWVIVGFHKVCITAGGKSCEIGQSFWDQMVNLKVDLVLTGHDHIYQRSKQLALSASCTSVTTIYNANCVVADGPNYVKGTGLIQVTDGVGGHSMYTIGTKSQRNYFSAYMGSNLNSQNKSNGYGSTLFRITATSITGTTDFCPAGKADSTGQCPSYQSTIFKDTFTISAPAGGPTARFSYTPAWPQPGASALFDASTSSDTNASATLQYRWDWTNDGTWDTAWSSVPTATHAYGAQGTYTAALEVQDTAGLTDSATQTVVVDGTAPATTASLSGTSGTNGWYRSSVRITLTATDPLSGVASTFYRVDGGAWKLYSSAPTVSGEGSHTFDYNSTDRAGNAETTHTLSFKIDTVAPSTGPTLQGTLVNGTYYAGPVNVTLTATDATSGVASTKYRVDGGSWLTYAEAVAVSGNGTHQFEYYSTDNAGNTEITKSVLVPIGGPAQGPVSTMNVSGNAGLNGWYVSTATVTLSATDPSGSPTTIYYQVDAGSWTTYSAPFTLTDGRHDVAFYAKNATNATELTKTNPVNVDTHAPSTTAALGGNLVSTYYEGPVNVTLTATDATSGVASTQYRLDGGSWQAYSATVVVSGNGTHVLEYDSTDHAGNTEGTKSVQIPIGAATLPPPVSLNLAGTTGSGGWYISDVTVTLNTSASSGVTIMAKIDGGAWTGYSGPIQLSDGRHEIEYYSVESSGANGTPESATVNVDTTPPTFTSHAPTGTLTTSEVTISWACVDALSGVAWIRVSVDGGPSELVGLTTSLRASLPDGDHDVVVRATDAAGNTAAQAISFRVDTNPFSLSGPFSGVPTYLLLELGIAVAAIFLYRRYKRKRRTEPRSSRQP